MLWIVLGIVLFLFLVLIHELGHFVAAKRTGVQVLEFGMGIPPKIMTLWTDKSGTEYTLNAIPLGGFVRLKGEDPNDEWTFKAKDSFVMASFRSKTIILLAGVTVNFLFARFMLTFLFWRWISPLSIAPENASIREIKSYLTPTVTFLMDRGYLQQDGIGKVVINQLIPWWLGEKIGLLSGDHIVAINTIPIDEYTFKQHLQDNIWKDFVLTVVRNGDALNTLQLTGSCPVDNCLLGIAINDVDIHQQSIHYQFPLWKATSISMQELRYQGEMTLYRLWQLWKSLISFDAQKIKSETKNLSGPVGAVKFGDILVKHNMRSQFLAFWALISFALAVFNLLPIPALDGGRWLWVIIQSVFFPKHIEKYFTIEWYLNFLVFWLLMILGIYILLKDLVVAWGLSIPFIG